MKIASYTITHNGLTDGTLEATIENLDKFADKIVVVVSKSSDDGTIEWVERNEKIDGVVKEDHDFPEEEAKIREKGYEAAKKFNPDWIAAIDDDEILAEPEKARRKLDMAKDNDIKECDFVAAKLYHVWQGEKYRTDGTWNPGNISRIIFRNITTDFEGEFNHGSDVHAGRLPVKNQSREAQTTGHINVIHFGWDKPQEKRVEKMKEKKANDSFEDKRPHYVKTQKKHYQSVHEEPELKELPEKYVENRGHLFK